MQDCRDKSMSIRRNFRGDLSIRTAVLVSSVSDCPLLHGFMAV